MNGILNWKNCGLPYFFVAKKWNLPPFLIGVFVVAILIASPAWAAPPVNAAKSTAIASPTTVIADGIATSTITVTVNRSNGVSAGGGITVTLTGTGSSTISPLSATTNNQGVATFTVKDTVVELVTYTATDTTDGVIITQKPTVNFVRAAPTVAKSFSPATIAAHGTSTLTITLTNPNTASISGASFTDAYPANLVNTGTPSVSTTCAGGTATASAGGTSLALSGGTIPASGSCTVSVTVTSATAGSYVNSTGAVTSTNASSSTSASATLVVTAISASLSTVTANPTTILANGVSTSTITVTLRDGAGLAVSGKTVTLSKSGGSSTISAASGTSDVNGVVTFTVKDTVAETATYTAKDTTDNITVTQTAAVTFIITTILKNFGTNPIAINGTSTLTVILTNPSSSSVGGAGFTDTYPAGLVNASNPSASGCGGSATLAGSTGSNSLGITGATIALNSTCTVTVSVTAATAGTYNNTATNTASVTSTASLTVTAISPTLSTVSASPTSVPADGISTSTITVTLKDGAGNPVSGKTVSLTAASGSSIITAVSNSGGVATFTVKDAVAEGPITYTAKDTTDNITVTQTASVTFTRITAPAVAKSFSPATIADYGTTTLTITLTNPNAAAITGVAFTDTYPATGGLVNTATLVLSNTCGGTNPGTAANGTKLTLSGGTIPASGSCSVSVQVTAAFPGTTASSPIVNATGTVTSVNANSGTSASATLTVVNVSATNSTVVASPTSVPADNTTTSTITVTLKDGAGNPVASANVSLAAGSGSSTITVVSATTDVNGIATFTVKDAVAESVTYTATETSETPNVVITQTATVTFNSPYFIQIQHATGTGVTCASSTLTLKACSNAACTAVYTGGVSGTLSASGIPTVNWAGGSGAFTIAVGSSTVTKDVQVTQAGTVVFGATTSPSTTGVTTCNFGSPSCTFTASDAGFIVTAPDHVSETSSTLTIKAVKKSDSSLACVPGMTGSKTVNLKCLYADPISGTLPVRIAGTALNATANAAAKCDASGSNIALTFDASGIATPSLQYADVGKMTVNASYTGVTGTIDAGLSLAGGGTFIVAPASFAFSGVTTGLIKAGNAYSATVTATNIAGATTSNFGKEVAAEGVTLTPNLVAPVGGINPAIANNAILGGSFSNGVATLNNLSWGEVGLITMTAKLTSTGYLGSTLTASGTSGNTGRFIPDHFDTVVKYDPVGKVFMSCPLTLTCPASGDLVYGNGFVYSGQAFTTQVTARNLGGAPTKNYDSGLVYSKNVALSAWNAAGGASADPAGGTMSANTVLASAFSLGVATTSTPIYTLPASTTPPVDIFVRAAESTGGDGVTSLRGVSSIEGGMKIVSGRYKISNAYGSELLSLGLSATIQYYNGTTWVKSSTDSTTTFNTKLTGAGGNLDPLIQQGPLAIANISVVGAGPVTVAAGVKSFTLNKPGVTGIADIRLTAPTYLLTGNNGAGVNPSVPGRITFGVYSGNNNFIYQRESY